MPGKKSFKLPKVSIVRFNYILSISFGLFMGMIFPFFAYFFVTFKSNTHLIIFTIGCLLAGFLVGTFSYLVLKNTILKIIRKISGSVKYFDIKNDYTKLLFNDEVGNLINTLSRYSYIIKNAPIGIYQRKLDDGYNFINLRYSKQLGCNDGEEFIEKYNKIENRWKYPQKKVEFNKLLIEYKEVINYEAEILLPSGEEKWFSISAYLQDIDGQNLINGFSIDITEKKIAELKIKELNEQLENKVTERTAELTKLNNEISEKAKELTILFEESPLSIILTDYEGIILQVNKKTEEITGYNRDEIIGKKTNIFKSNKTDITVYFKMWETIKSGNIWVGELINRRKNGEEYWEKITINPIKDCNNKIVKFLSVKDDITSQKIYEKIKDRVERIMRHDLKTPLQSIINFPELLMLDENV
ncbi:MAG TPA: PAS domain-containing protein, partial [Spirochaetota bacterium]|nr:PAS domain-containing protein [Spirochaetota bacterium]